MFCFLIIKLFIGSKLKVFWNERVFECGVKVVKGVKCIESWLKMLN